MAITNLYPNLPGHLVQFKDGGLTATNATSDQSGKSLLLLGTAFDGPLMEPVRIDEYTLNRVFGDEVDVNGYPNGATIPKYAKQAFKAGFHDVRCMRVTGKQAEAKVMKSYVEETQYDFVEDTFTVQGNSATTINLQHGDILGGTNNINDAPANSEPKVYDITDPNNLQQILSVGFNNYNGTLNINANVYRAHAPLKVDYYYYDRHDGEETVTITSPSNDTITLADLIPSSVTNGIIYSTGTYDVGNKTNGLLQVEIKEGGTFRVLDPTAASPEYTIDYAVDPVERDLEHNIAANIGKVNGITIDSSLLASATTEDPIEIKVSFVYADIVHVDGETSNGDTEYKLEGNYYGENNNYFTLSGVPAQNPEADYFSKIAKRTVNEITTYYVGGDSDEDPNEYYISNNKLYLREIGQWGEGQTIKIKYYKARDIVIEESFVVQAVYGGEGYNGSKITFEYIKDPVTDEYTGETMIIFSKPASKVINASDGDWYYTTENVKTVGQLRDQLEAYEYNNVFQIITDDDNLSLYGIVDENNSRIQYSLQGGEDGINPTDNDMFEALSGVRYTQADVALGECTAAQVGYLKTQGAYQILENYHVDYIIPLGVYADSQPTKATELNTSFHHELAMVCAVLTYRTKMTHGFIDVKPNNNTTLKGIQKYTEHLIGYDNIHYMKDQEGKVIVDSNGDKMDIGWYTSLVVGPDPIYISDKLGRYYGSPAISYAALCSSIAPESAPTHKRIPGAVGMRFSFSNKQLNEIVGNKMVVFMIKNSNTTAKESLPYVVDGCTSGAPSCDYTRMSTVKVVTDVVDQVREVCDPFLGEPNTKEQRNAMSALIAKRLSYLHEHGEINYYEFQVDATLEEILIGECTITLTLAVPQELRKITTTVALRAAA